MEQHIEIIHYSLKEKGEWEWAYKTNNKGKQIKYKKATDPDGNTYIVGSCSSSSRGL
jgi:hypothetical protein